MLTLSIHRTPSLALPPVMSQRITMWDSGGWRLNNTSPPDQINKTADRMYALFALCNALSPSRLDDNILNIVKDRYGDQFAKLSRGCVVRPSFVPSLGHARTN